MNEIQEEIMKAEAKMALVLEYLKYAKQESDKVLEKLQDLAESTKGKGE